MPIDYPLAWAIIVVAGICIYACLDGFDLGVGILHLVAPHHKHDLMSRSIMPFWDGNETWLILVGGSMYAIFPFVYSYVFPLLYEPIMLMIFALVFRGICFEFRFKTSHQNRWLWSLCFGLASLLIATFQGVIIGNFIIGLPLELTGDLTLSSFSPFSLHISPYVFTTILIYMLLGSTWLWMKMPNQNTEYFRWVSMLTLPFFLLMSLKHLPTTTVETYLTLLEIAVCTSIVFFLWKKSLVLPFVSSMILTALKIVGGAFQMYPYIVPQKVTIWQAAGSPQTLELVFNAAIVLVPIVCAYSFYTYYIFHGKVSLNDLPSDH